MMESQEQDSELGGKRKAEVISVYVAKELKEGLEEWAAEEERTVSWIVSKLIQKALEERKAREAS